MTIQDVQQRIKEIQDQAGDDEKQHDMEDDLYQEVLRAIANGAPNAKKLAAEALKTLKIDFSRWCA